MKRTLFAQQGLDFVTLFSAKFGRTKVSGYLPMLREPVADSTGGGKQAVQHMILQPQVEGDPVLTVGAVNVATKTAKLRTYDCMREMHVLRFGNRPFLLDQAQYQEFFDKAMEFMRRQGMQVEVETHPPSGMHPSTAPPAASGGSMLIWTLVAVFVVVAAAAVYFTLTGRIVF